MVSMPMKAPTAWFIFSELKNDPCPQSCCTMKRRTMRPAVGMANTAVARKPKPWVTETAVRAQPAMKRARVVPNCVHARAFWAFAKGAISSRRETSASLRASGVKLRLSVCESGYAPAVLSNMSGV